MLVGYIRINAELEQLKGERGYRGFNPAIVQPHVRVCVLFSVSMVNILVLGRLYYLQNTLFLPYIVISVYLCWLSLCWCHIWHVNTAYGPTC